MARYAARRLLLAIPVLLAVSFLVFAWTRALPGGPAQALLGERATPEAVAAIERQYGLDRPLVVQYGKYLERIASGDFGLSVATQRPVARRAARALPRHLGTGVRGDAVRRRRRRPTRHRGRQARPPTTRPRQPRRFADRHQHAHLLPRPDPQVGVLRAPWLAAEHRSPRRQDRPRPAHQPVHRRLDHLGQLGCAVGHDPPPDPPGDRPRHDPAGDHHPDHQDGGARGDAGGPCPHGPRQGPAAAGGRSPAHPAQRPPPRHRR